MLQQQIKTAFCRRSNRWAYYNDLHQSLSADFQSRAPFSKKYCPVINETAKYDLIFLSQICQHHFETRATNVWELSKMKTKP